jgi:hypothetical protein
MATQKTAGINYYNYDLQCSLKWDFTLPEETLVSFEKCLDFEKNRILAFSIVKNIYSDNNIPMSSITLDSLNDQEFFVITNKLAILEVTVSINSTKIYKNIYKIQEVYELENSTSKYNYSSKKVQIILQNQFVWDIIQDNNFYKLNRINTSSFTNYDLLLDSFSFIGDTYGSSIIGNLNISDRSLSSFNDYYFNIHETNFEQLDKLVHDNRVSNDITLFGIDECFSAMTSKGVQPSGPVGTSSEIIIFDIASSNSLRFIDSGVTEFIKTYNYEMGNTTFVENFFSNEFIKNFIQCKFRYKNSFTNEIFDLPALKTTNLLFEKDGNSLPIETYVSSGPDSIFESSGNLTLQDIQAYRENILKFLEKQPKIYTIPFSKAPLDVFKLGRKINFGNLPGHTISVAAEINFVYSTDIERVPGEVRDGSVHTCTGNLFVLNWQE